MTPVQLFLDNFKENPRNFLNTKETIIGNTLVELNSIDDYTIHISSIRAIHRQKGHGSNALKELCELADNLSVNLQLFPKSYGAMTNTQLEKWYSKYGFVKIGDKMIRMPKKILKLSNKMKVIDLKEYQITSIDPAFDVKQYDLKNAEIIAHTSIHSEICNIYKIGTESSGNQVIYILAKINGKLPADSKNDEIIAYVGIEIFDGNVCMAKNAWCDSNFRRKGAITELLYFINTKFYILSDVVMTLEGESLWNSLKNNSRFDLEIFYVPDKETIPLSYVGKKYKNIDVIDPESDSKSDYIWTENNQDGQQFFYILVLKSHIVYEKRKFPIYPGQVNKGPMKLIIPYSKSSVGDI